MTAANITATLNRLCANSIRQRHTQKPLPTRIVLCVCVCANNLRLYWSSGRNRPTLIGDASSVAIAKLLEKCVTQFLFITFCVCVCRRRSYVCILHSMASDLWKNCAHKRAKNALNRIFARQQSSRRTFISFHFIFMGKLRTLKSICSRRALLMRLYGRVCAEHKPIFNQLRD